MHFLLVHAASICSHIFSEASLRLVINCIPKQFEWLIFFQFLVPMNMSLVNIIEQLNYPNILDYGGHKMQKKKIEILWS